MAENDALEGNALARKQIIDATREQLALYERSGGTEGTTVMDGLPTIIVTHTGRKSGATRKIGVMRVKLDNSYVLVGSQGALPTNPSWVYNLRANPEVEIRDETEVFPMRVREVTDEDERKRVWAFAVETFPTYGEYQTQTSRKLPVFLAEPT